MAQHEEGGMSENVLAYQFVAGLNDALRAKLVGAKGTFDEVLTRARFEEARMKEREKSSSHHTTLSTPANRISNTSKNQNANASRTTQTKSDRRCYSCGGTGHMARDCSLQGRGAPVESRGRGSTRGAGQGSQSSGGCGGNSRNTQVSILQVGVCPGTEVTKHEATDSEEEHGVTPTGNREVTTTDSNHEVITNVVKQVMATMYGAKVSKDTAMLGPTPTTEVLLDHLPVLDTGSPISIVSLEFFLKSAAKKRTSAQTPAEWGKAV